MSTISELVTSSTTDAYGNTVTSSVSNDELTSEDFITLMLKELELQDPTETVDSSSIMSSQLQLSTLTANTATVVAMEALQASFENSTLANSASLIGNIIENGDLNDEGTNKQYQVASVEGVDGVIYLSVYELSEYYDLYSFDETLDTEAIINDSNEDSSMTFTKSDGTEISVSTYNKSYEDIAAELSLYDGVTASMVENTNGQSQLVVSLSGGNSTLSQSSSYLSYSKSNASSYNSDTELIPYSAITKIY